MRINKYNFKKKEDKAVFKALMRCMKEDRNLYILNRVSGGCGGARVGFEEVVRRCYVSRENHRNENFQTNIFFWPEDSGGLLKSSVTKFIYISLIINSLNCKIKELGTRFQELYSTICNNPKGGFYMFGGDISAYHQCIADAFIKCGIDEELANDKANTIELLARAYKMDLPF